MLNQSNLFDKELILLDKFFLFDYLNWKRFVLFQVGLQCGALLNNHLYLKAILKTEFHLKNKIKNSPHINFSSLYKY